MKTKTRDEYGRALDTLTRLLAMRDHSRAELRQKLLKRYSEELVNQILIEASESGWLAPDEVVSARMAAALGRKLKSRRYIEGALKKKGLKPPPREVEAYSEPGEDERAKIRELVERRFGPPAELSFDDKARAFRFLKYRGFEDRWIRQVLNEKS